MTWISFVMGVALQAAEPPVEPGAAEFDKQRIGEVTYEACSAFDVNRDGRIDIVSGEYWFEGPEFRDRHRICTVEQVGDYYDDFADQPMDVNGDGFLDIVSGGWFGETLTWRENPAGRPVEWTVHKIAEVGNIEKPCFWDIDGDGFLDVAPNTPGNPQRIFRLVRDGNGKGLGRFQGHTIAGTATGHGLGFGDINGDGRGDFVVNSGWFEAPERPFEETWEWHPEWALFKSASVPILVHDVNGDGRNDLIVGNGHDYGLAWWEQRPGEGRPRDWVRHDIDTTRSQYHEAMLADVDNDGEPELITGKRWHAHSGTDPGADDLVGLYYFELKGGAFEPVVIDAGTADLASGTGIALWVADIDGDGRNDVLAPGKEGLYFFRSLGPAE